MFDNILFNTDHAAVNSCIYDEFVVALVFIEPVIGSWCSFVHFEE